MPLYDGIAMGVLVQPMVSLSGHCYAFIAFSKDPLGLCADSLGELFVKVGLLASCSMVRWGVQNGGLTDT